MLTTPTRLLLATWPIAICCSCQSSQRTDTYLPPAEQEEVEIAPGSFLTIEKRDWTVDDPNNKSGKEKTRLTIPYRNIIVSWEGIDIPVVMREKENRLYMIGYDRETGRLSGDDRKRYNYYRQDGEWLYQIEREEFPKEMATQNMWVSKHEFAPVLALDTSSLQFQMSSNAFIWEHLMTGDVQKDSSVDKELLDNFADRFKPVKLTAIDRRKTGE